MSEHGGYRANAGRKSAVTEQATADAHILYHRSRAKREAHKAKIAELDERKRKRELLEAADVRREADTAARTVRDAFLALPDRVASMLVGLPEDQILEALRSEVRDTLASLSKTLSAGNTDADSERKD